MPTGSPHLDRLGAALKAVRKTHPQDLESDTALGAKCLAVLIEHLAEQGLPQEDLQPLVDLEARLRGPRGEGGPPNRRRGEAPSDALLARIAAVIDALVTAGYDEGEAAQIIARRMLAAGISPPLKGGDARGWKRLLSWRSDLLSGLGSTEARNEYHAFTRQLEAIPPAERVKAGLDDQLWNRRHGPR